MASVTSPGRQVRPAADHAPRRRSCGGAPGTGACRTRPRTGAEPETEAMIVATRASLVVERRQQPRDRPGQQRLAGSGRADHDQAVAAGQGDLQRPARLQLAAHLGQVRDWRSAAGAAAPRSGRLVADLGRELDPRRLAAGRARGAPRAESGRLRERGRRRRRRSPPASRASATPSAGTTTRLTRRRARAATIGSSPGTGRSSPPSDSSPRTAQRPAARHLLRPDQDPERDRQVQRRAALAQVRRGQVHRDPARRVLVAAVADGAADALAGLLQGRVRQPDDREARQPGATSTSTRIGRPSRPWSVAESSDASTPPRLRGADHLPAYRPADPTPTRRRADAPTAWARARAVEVLVHRLDEVQQVPAEDRVRLACT